MWEQHRKMWSHNLAEVEYKLEASDTRYRMKQSLIKLILKKSISFPLPSQAASGAGRQQEGKSRKTIPLHTGRSAVTLSLFSANAAFRVQRHCSTVAWKCKTHPQKRQRKRKRETVIVNAFS